MTEFYSGDDTGWRRSARWWPGSATSGFYLGLLAIGTKLAQWPEAAAD
ncbi:hypothetical protein C9413_24865 [Rhizobium sp. SEMIA 4085]|nr:MULTISPECIES: hypothetical protein [Rhizobium]NNH32563.1 hypothetical protein [Rhizobium sp. SEMIA 4085]